MCVSAFNLTNITGKNTFWNLYQKSCMHHHRVSSCCNLAKEDAISVYIQRRREPEPFIHGPMHIFLLRSDTV